mmetsp:Transcript_8477/g.24912  ORF Transcript_8477/g.24912 Transcript_8477/m.24912 type:complete len:223 (-) Transcript_8477:24-692(-)
MAVGGVGSLLLLMPRHEALGLSRGHLSRVGAEIARHLAARGLARVLQVVVRAHEALEAVDAVAEKFAREHRVSLPVHELEDLVISTLNHHLVHCQRPESGDNTHKAHAVARVGEVAVEDVDGARPPVVPFAVHGQPGRRAQAVDDEDVVHVARHHARPLLQATPPSALVGVQVAQEIRLAVARRGRDDEEVVRARGVGGEAGDAELLDVLIGLGDAHVVHPD